ncbi:DUF1636 domain-containing protein [Zavarzinia compransoris]|uniref:DUF1636 family protein n=1 Tax=Zavarzinia marina TaxID=2911065 RepID=UPI001F2B739A|nr:DUF1636 domain-containing protein [Zavarzinia marina]MCF4167381.1 DUF1636 domain-containing protein [Zavarzinia marina]
MAVTLHVCITCRAGRPVVEGEPCAGERLHAALQGAPIEGVTIAPVSCLSTCSKGCAVALAAPGRWTYVYGGITPESDAPDVAEGARLYAGAPDGIVPWRERPELFRRNIVARIPPQEA